MAGVGHNAAFAKEVGIPQKVGIDFYNADVKAGKFKPKTQRTVPNHHFAHGRPRTD